jgi:hypothetical protein
MPPGASCPVQDSAINPQIAEHRGVGHSGRRRLLIALCLAMVTAVLVHGIHKGEFSENVDETVHASTGLYIASFLHDLPLRHPVQYTYRYYAQYPSLGIVMYPPAFYTVEGIAFFLFGPSVVTARASIILFALLGLFFWFKLVDELEDEYTAALSTLLLAFMPSVLNYEKTVMLDIPLMSLCIAASYFWVVYLRRGLWRHLYWFTGFLCLAFLTKHHAIYLLLWCPVTLALQKKWERVLNWRAATAAVVSFVVVAPAYILQIFTNASVALNVQGTSANASTGWSYYLTELPGLIGWGALILSVIGIALAVWRGNRENTVLMLAWIVCCYVVFTLIRHKEARYIIYWVPAFAYFAIAPFMRLKGLPWARIAGIIAVVAVVTLYTARAWTYQRAYVSGYGQMAQRLTQMQGGVVLVDMDLPGNFIFFMRAYDPARRFVILRKALYEVRTVREWGATEFAHNQADVEQILKNDSVRYVVVEKNMPLRFSSQSALRDVVENSGQYKMLGTIPIESNMNGWGDRSLILYESSVPVVPAHGMLHIKMQNLHHDIDIPFEQLTQQ